MQGIISLCLFMPLILGVSSCSTAAKTESDMDDNNTISYLALGDSYTIGEGVVEFERWPVLLADTLRKMGFNMDTPQIIARTGWTTADLMGGIEQAKLQGPFDMVSLLIGVNNQYRGVSRGYTLASYRQEFEELLRLAISFAGGKTAQVIVLSIPDYGFTPFVAPPDKERVSREIDAYNAVNRELALLAGVHYIDITPVSRLAAENPAWLVADRLHPSGLMYRAWVELIVRDFVPKH